MAAFPAFNPDDVAVTPYRRTRLVCGLPEYRKLRTTWGRNFRGARLSSSAGTQAGHNQNAFLLPSDSWCIASWEMQMQFERSQCDGNEIGPIGADPSVEFAPGFETFVSQSRIPGVTYDSSVVTLGSYWARKRRASSADWHAELSADAAVFPKPAGPTSNAPMRRVAHHLGTIHPNNPVYVRFFGPASPLATNDAILTWYFGGDTATQYPDGTADPSGGAYALMLFGSGRAVLWEHTETSGAFYPWREVDEFEWETRGKIPNQQHVLIMIPEGADTLNLVGTGFARYIHPPANVTGYNKKAAMTGAGSLRLDMREDLRCPFQFGGLSFPASGAFGSAHIYGVPFRTALRLQANSQIFPELDFIIGPGGGVRGVSVQVYDAKTNEALPAGAAGSFLTLHASQRDYYAVYSLSDDDNNRFTPFLRGCNFRVEGSIALYTPTSYTGGLIQEAQINGPEVEVDCDTANLTVEDPLAELADGATAGGLDAHADIHAQLQCTYDPADQTKYKVMFDGTIVQAPAVQNRSAASYPVARWKTYRVQMAGAWYRLQQSWEYPAQSRDFTSDPASGIDPDTNRPYPWQIIDMLAEGLKQAGFGTDQIHMRNPDGGSTNGPRLYGNGRNVDDFFLMPGVKLADMCQHLSKDYLGARLIFDKEALPHGRWILVYPPALSGGYSPVWTFVCDTPSPSLSGTQIMPVHLPQAYPDKTTFITNVSTWVTPPEGNLFVVACAAGDLAQAVSAVRSAIPGTGGSAQLCAAVGVNYRSTDFTALGYPSPLPSHMDWVPYGIKPVRIINPSFMAPTIERTNEALRLACRRVMTFSAYGLRHFQFLAPLVHYYDPDTAYGGGPRDLRTYDLIDVAKDGATHHVLLENCSPSIGVTEGGDMAQWAEYRGFELPVPLSY